MIPAGWVRLSSLLSPPYRAEPVGDVVTLPGSVELHSTGEVGDLSARHSKSSMPASVTALG